MFCKIASRISRPNVFWITIYCFMKEIRNRLNYGNQTNFYSLCFLQYEFGHLNFLLGAGASFQCISIKFLCHFLCLKLFFHNLTDDIWWQPSVRKKEEFHFNESTLLLPWKDVSRVNLFCIWYAISHLFDAFFNATSLCRPFKSF